MRNGKKGQFYILTAIVLCSLVFAFATRVSDISSPFKKSEYLYENYIQEAYIAINSALLESGNVSERFVKYTDDYVEYARTVDTNFSQAIVVRADDLLVLNRFKVPINITVYDELEKYDKHTWTELDVGNQVTASIMDYMDIRVGKRTFTIDISEIEDTYSITGIYLIERKFYKFRQV